MPAFPSESTLFPTGNLDPAVAKSIAQQWFQATKGSRGANIASAATINLDAATGDLVDVTGTTTITAITLADGAQKTVRFTGALTLTNGANLVLLGGADITTAAGDFAVFRGYASGVVRMVSFNGRIASQTETDAGTDDIRTVTPKKLRAGFSASFATNGFIAFPSWLGGFIIQWAGVASPASANSTTAITWPVAFPNAVYAVAGTPFAGLDGAFINYSFESPSKTGANFVVARNTAAILQVKYIAVGK
jgi:hypothetical protein